jgi:calcineurin-like phosphoesterase family protein
LKGGRRKKGFHAPFQRTRRLKGEFFWGQINGKEKNVGKEINNYSPIPQEEIGKNVSKTCKERMMSL